MANPNETVALTTQPQQPQAVVAANQNPYYGQAAAQQNVQYVYTQPTVNAQGQPVQYVYTQPAGAPQTQPQQQVIIMQPNDSEIAREAQKEEIRQYQNQQHGYGHHQPNHQPPSQDKEPSYKYDDGTDAEVQVVKWENFKLPIPLNHATFMRKVWCTLVLQLIFTAGMIAMCMYVDEIREWVVKNYWMWIIGLFGAIYTMCCLFPARNKYPLNLFLLFLFTAFMAYTVSMVCAAYAEIGMADIVLQAFGITILVFLGLSIFSCQTKCNLMPLGMIAFMMISVMFWWGLWAIIFGWYNTSAWALIFIIIFCLLIMFDVWRMCNMPVFDEGAWILGAINLYLDVINLFLWILRFMALTQN